MKRLVVIALAVCAIAIWWRDVFAPNVPESPGMYIAVIFTSARALPLDDEYSVNSQRMEELARAQPGFIEMEHAGDTSMSITISYWQTMEDAAAWKRNAEHIAAQTKGRDRFYEWFKVRIVRVQREYAFRKIRPPRVPALCVGSAYESNVPCIVNAPFVREWEAFGKVMSNYTKWFRKVGGAFPVTLKSSPETLYRRHDTTMLHLPLEVSCACVFLKMYCRVILITLRKGNQKQRT
jgi:heme-degrading monooxygenase HmoA